MTIKWMLCTALAAGICGCAKNGGQTSSSSAPQDKIASAETQGGAAESGEIKLSIDQTPAPVRQTINRELAGAELEDIAKKTVDGQTIYETDIVKSGQKWELWVAEDGKVVHKLQEGGAEEQAADKMDAKAGGADGAGAGGEGFRQTFDVRKSELMATGNNPYITMQPGRVSKLIDKNGDTLTITILPEVREVDGVKVGVLEERETKDHQLAEISRNFFATDKNTGDVYYFGEDVDNYKDGKITSHESAWRAGEKGARFGLQIPARPRAGDKFYQEIAPKVAMDRVEVVSTDETVKVPAGTFQHCVHLKETTPIEPDVSHKYYAPGVGMIKDDGFELAAKP